VPNAQWFIDHKPDLFEYALARLCRRDRWSLGQDPEMKHLGPARSSAFLWVDKATGSQARWALTSPSREVNSPLGSSLERGRIKAASFTATCNKPNNRVETKKFIEARGWTMTFLGLEPQRLKAEHMRLWTPPQRICAGCPHLLACTLEGTVRS
jgi:hypothetical protein